MLLEDANFDEISEHFSFGNSINFEERIFRNESLLEQIQDEVSSSELSDNDKNMVLSQVATQLAHDYHLIRQESMPQGEAYCVTLYNICVQGAENDFAVSSAACTAVGPGWAFCQGSSFLVYVADIAGCNQAYEDCNTQP